MSKASDFDKFILDPQQLSDEVATRMGLRVYNSDLAGVDGPNVDMDGSTNISQADFIPYQTQDGSWRMRFNLSIRRGSVLSTAATITISGISFEDNVTNRQVVAVHLYNSSSSISSQGAVDLQYCNPGTNTIIVNRNGSNFNHCDASGDVKIAGKPTWAV